MVFMGPSITIFAFLCCLKTVKIMWIFTERKWEFNVRLTNSAMSSWFCVHTVVLLALCSHSMDWSFKSFVLFVYWYGVKYSLTDWNDPVLQALCFNIYNSIVIGWMFLGLITSGRATFCAKHSMSSRWRTSRMKTVTLSFCTQSKKIKKHKSTSASVLQLKSSQYILSMSETEQSLQPVITASKHFLYTLRPLY